jgi:ABC-type multidrug transport system ATPase subunit
MTVIYTSHYIEEARRLCHRVAIFGEGQIIALDTPTALIRGLGGGILVLGWAVYTPFSRLIHAITGQLARKIPQEIGPANGCF